MTDRGIQSRLDDLPFEAAAPRPEVVIATIGSMPEDRTQLAAIISAWADDEALPDSPLGREAEKSIGDRIRFAVARGTHHSEAHARRSGRSDDLFKLIVRSGRRMADVGLAIGLDGATLGGLVAGRFDPDTVPARVSRLIAGAIGSSTDLVVMALRSPRRAAAATMGPAQNDMEDFAEALLKSDLSEIEKHRMLGLRRGR